MPFGYGPAAKAIALARRLREDWRLVFVGRGSALELVSRTSGLFDEILPGSATDPACAERIARAWGVLSVMDRDAGVAARRCGRPLFVVDSLAWMRPRAPEALADARVYWAQRFGGLAAEGFEPRPSVVGPILAPTAGARRPRDGGLVVHLGGSAAPRGREALYAAYARFVVKAVIGAGLGARFPRISVLGGGAAIASLDGVLPPGLAQIGSAAPEEARALMERAGAVLTAPGLTTSLECFLDGTPTWFLPPQNYSQWCILRHMRGAGVADDALHWEDLRDVPKLAERMAPEIRDPIVCAEIEALVASARAGAALRSRLRGVGEGAGERVSRQSAYVASLGPPALETIASTLRRLALAPHSDLAAAAASH